MMLNRARGKRRSDRAARGLRVCYPAGASEVLRFAAAELCRIASRMSGEPCTAEAERALGDNRLALCPDGGELSREAVEALAGGPGIGARSFEREEFAVATPASGEPAFAGAPAVLVLGGSERAVLHGVYELAERQGARWSVGSTMELPKRGARWLSGLGSYRISPPFQRVAFACDLMTWHYERPAYLARHLEHDREFIGWVAWRGAGAFFFIRHASDTRLKIDELAAFSAPRGIAFEYGGHLLTRLLPRAQFETAPELFTMGSDGRRGRQGNLCASSARALKIVSRAALAYAREKPTPALLHLWGADVFAGAWCLCPACRRLGPQLQYMRVVNAVAAELWAAGERRLPVAYLAYHDTLEPDPRLKPRRNVWFEWAPRERCYRHAIDDPACRTNPRYFESLKRHLDLFDGRGHVFEYYADAALFGGLGFATAAVIARDLRAYRRLGLQSISCLTFGAYSALAYPVNLETFARAATRGEDVPALGRIARLRHPGSAGAAAAAYRAVVRASALTLTYGDVMRAPPASPCAGDNRGALREAAACFRRAVAAAAALAPARAAPRLGAERQIWRYSAGVLSGLADYAAALLVDEPRQRRRQGAAALARVAACAREIEAVDPRYAGLWGTLDLARLRQRWLASLARRLEATLAPGPAATATP